MVGLERVTEPGESPTWGINLLEKTATHGPTGLVVRFTASLDGSGSMQAQPLNPECLGSITTRLQAQAVAAMPMEAWAAYAQASEDALAREWAERESSPSTQGGTE